MSREIGGVGGTNLGGLQQVGEKGTQKNEELASKVTVPKVKDLVLPLAQDQGGPPKPLASRTITIVTDMDTPKETPIGLLEGSDMSARGKEGNTWGNAGKWEGMISLPGDTRAELQKSVEVDRDGRAWQTKSDKQNFMHEKMGPHGVPGLDPPEFSALMKHADVDRLKQATGEQSAFIGKLKERFGPSLDIPEGPRTYNTRQEFEADARDLLVGRDAGNKPINKREELARGWALFSNAKNAQPHGEVGKTIDKFIVFGRTPDVNHTDAGKLGYTSEYNNGAVLMPERWNYFMNTCWVMGGVKGEAHFVSGTSFERLTRPEVADKESERSLLGKSPTKQINATEGGGVQNKLEDDFRSDWTEELKPTEPLLHYTLTVSVSELTALKAFGYHAQKHEEFGVILVPGTSPQDVEKRENASFTEFQLKLNEARVGMALENISGDDYIAPGLQDYVLQHDKGSVEVQKVRAFVNDITTNPKGDVSESTNYLVRKVDIKMAAAMERVREAVKSHDSSTPGRLAGARQELAMSVFLATEHQLGKTGTGLSPQQKDIVDLEMLRTLGAKPLDGSALGWTTFEDIGVDVDVRIKDIASLETSPVAALKDNLDKVKAEFLNYVATEGRDDASVPPGFGEKTFGKDEGEALFASFRRDLALDLGTDPGIAKLDLSAAFRAYVDKHEYRYG
jgi:hypothetical protein